MGREALQVRILWDNGCRVKMRRKRSITQSGVSLPSRVFKKYEKQPMKLLLVVAPREVRSLLFFCILVIVIVELIRQI